MILRFEQIVVEPEHGVVGTSSTMVTLSHTDGQFKVEARGALVQGKQINLIDPVKKSGDRKTELTSVVLYEGKSEITEPIQEEPIRQEPIRQEPIREELIREELIREEPGEGVPIHIEPKAEEPPVAEDENIISEKEALAFSRERDIWSKDAGEDKALGFSKTFNAFTAPIVPGVAFSITLTPEASIGLSFHTGANEIRLDGDRKTATLTAGAALSGSLSLTLGAEVEAGLLFLISAYGGINATAGLSGSGDGNALAAAEISIPIVKEKGSIGIDRTKEITAEFNAGLNLTGAISADVGVKSALFAWEKSLYEYTFKTWNLAELSFSASMVRTYAPGMPLYKGWKAGDKNWTAQAFGKSFLEKYKAENHFGLLEKQHNRSVSFVGQAQRSYEEALVFLENLKNQDGKYIVAITKDQGDGTMDSFLSRLLEVSQALNLSSINSEIALIQLGNELRECMASKFLKKALAFEAKRTEKHGKRIAELENWKTSSEKKDFKKDFREYFSLTSGYQEHVKQEAMKKVMTPENVKVYEKKRLEERKKKHTERIEHLKLYAEKDRTGQGKTDSEVREYYITVLGAKRQRKHLAEFSEVEKIMTYEQKRLEEVQIKHSQRLKKLRDKEAALEIQDESVVNPEFARYYFNDMEASAMLKVLAKYADTDEILAYETKRLTEKGDKDRLTLLMKWREKLPDEADFKAKDPQNFNRQEKELKNSKNRYKTKTTQDLIDYETKRMLDLEEKSVWKTLRDTSMSQEEIEELGKDKKVSANYKSWIKENTEQAIQRLNLDSLIRYEEKKSKDESKGMKHKNRLSTLKTQKVELEGIKENERSDAEQKRVALYLNRNNEASSGLMDALKNGRYFDKNIMEYSELDNLNKVKAGYKERLKFLENFKGPGKKFYRAYIIYEYMVKEDLLLKKEIKEGKIGKEDFQAYAGEMQGDIDMAARLRYEEFCMSEKVTRDKKQTEMLKEQKKGGETTAEVAENEETVEDPLKYADHLSRYDTLKSIYDDKELEEEERYQKMLEVYKQMGGGEGFEKAVKAKGTADITPKAIIRYEEDRKIEVGSKHQKRIDYLEANKNMDYDQLLEGYEAMARGDGTGILGAVKAKSNTYFTVGKIGFERSMDIHAMTAEKILLHEEQRSEEVALKSRKRLNLLETDKSDEEKIEDYVNAGGGQGFYRAEKDLIDAEKEKLNSLPDDQMHEKVLKYEKERHDYYGKKYAASQKILDDIMENQEKMKRQIEDTNKKIEELAAIRQEPGELLKRLGAIHLGTAAQIMDNEEKITQKSEAERVIERGTDISQEMQQMISFMEDEEEEE